MAQLLCQFPNIRIPAALKSRADIEEAYRFFDNKAVTPKKIITPHIEATDQRIDAVDFALLAIDSIENVQRVISSYCTRWPIEVSFRTLKSGCQIEQRRFEAISRVSNAWNTFGPGSKKISTA